MNKFLKNIRSELIKIPFFCKMGNFRRQLLELFKKNEITVLKKSKKGEKMVDIKPMIKNIKYWVKDNELVVNALISCGSRENLSADLLATLIKDNTKNYAENTFTYIKYISSIFLFHKNILSISFKFIFIILLNLYFMKKIFPN